MKSLKHLFKNNKQWAENLRKQDPTFFKNLSNQQTPEYLWIGCSDSRVPANQIVNLAPGEVFVHRNIANVVVHTDLNCLSVIQFAVDILKVKHIIVCGHYGCGGIKSAIEKTKYGHKTKKVCLIDNWLGHIEDVARFNKDELKGLSKEDYYKRMCELNVMEQVNNVCNTSIVNKAWNDGAELTVHGWIYDIHNGILKDLKTGVNTSSKRKH